MQTKRERLAHLRLARSENVGPATFHELLTLYGNATDALEALPGLAARGGGKRKIRICPAREAEKEYTALDKLGGRILFFGEPEYPPLLARTTPPPPLISVLGSLSLVCEPHIAIVGARNASAVGLRLAGELAHALGEHGYPVASGLARGIDGAAHTAAMASGTTAVLANGVDVIYPSEHKQLYNKIRECGALVSEMPLGTKPQGRHFPRRNRIISGLSLGVLIVEAAPRSGSLITARYAIEQNRDVMAVPGSPLDPRAQGCNQLIKQGATLVEDVEDILHCLKNAAPRTLLSEPAKPDYQTPRTVPQINQKDRDTLTGLLGPTAIEVDDLVRLSGLPAREVAVILLELDLAGFLNREPDNRVALNPPET